MHMLALNLIPRCQDDPEILTGQAVRESIRCTCEQTETAFKYLKIQITLVRDARCA